MSKLFEPLRVGNVELQNRIVMAPLTRFRANDSHVPLPFVAEHYAQRASTPGTLLIAEGTMISPFGSGFANAPGIWTTAQIAAWKPITAAVHSKGSFIFMQLFAMGRAASADLLANEFDLPATSASDIPFEGGDKPVALQESQIWDFVEAFKQAALNAIEAGFDGVEVHCANGYLIDQFLQDTSNARTDGWGGSVEKRARFGLEVTKAVVEAVGKEKVGLRLSPFSTFQGMRMEDPVPQFTYFVKELKKLGLAYLHLVESRIAGSADSEGTEKIDFLVDLWDNQSPILLAGGFKTDSAYRAADEEYKDIDLAIVFGRYFITNPDLVFRVKNKLEFTPYDRSKFYNAKQEDGYTTWANSKEFEAQKLRL